MATETIQIKIDAKVKQEADALFFALGLDMSSAVNLFLHQCILRGDLPFPIELSCYNQETLEAMTEAKKISHDPAIAGYSNIHELKKALEK